MIAFSSIFTRRVLLYLLLAYDRLGIEPTLSYGYTGSVRDGEWGVQLSTLEALVYPLHANLYEAFHALCVESRQFGEKDRQNSRRKSSRGET